MHYDVTLRGCSVTLQNPLFSHPHSIKRSKESPSTAGAHRPEWLKKITGQVRFNQWWTHRCFNHRDWSGALQSMVDTSMFQSSRLVRCISQSMVDTSMFQSSQRVRCVSINGGHIDVSIIATGQVRFNQW